MNSTAACVLGLLQLGPAPGPTRSATWSPAVGMSGWELNETAAVSVGLFWNVTRGQVYAELKRLAAAGFVEPVGPLGSRGQQRYRITDAGRAAFASWLAGWADRESGDELLRSTPMLAVFFGDYVDRHRLLRLLRTHRLRTERLLQRHEVMLAALGQPQSLPATTLRFGIARERATLQWLDEVVALLDSPGARGDPEG